MKLVWHISRADVDRLNAFLSTAASDPLVQARVATNIAATKVNLSRSAFWHAMVACLLTTQQKSGPDSAVAKFIRARPFPLSYHSCAANPPVAPFVTTTLSKFGGIRRSRKIGYEVGKNLQTLENGLWDEVLSRINSLLPMASQKEELEVAEYLDELLAGIGPKQSRNLLQGIGFTRYEIPIDSRLIKWLNQFGFPVHLSATALADRHYYNFVSTGIQRMCDQAGVFPCVLDAAIFASFDGGRWSKQKAESWGYDGDQRAQKRGAQP